MLWSDYGVPRLSQETAQPISPIAFVNGLHTGSQLYEMAAEDAWHLMPRWQGS